MKLFTTANMFLGSWIFFFFSSCVLFFLSYELFALVAPVDALGVGVLLVRQVVADQHQRVRVAWRPMKLLTVTQHQLVAPRWIR